MSSPSSVLFRHALRVLLTAAGAAVLVAAPPAMASGLPGPGLWPGLAGAGLVICALTLPGSGTKQTPLSPGALRRALGFLLSCLLWIGLLPIAGMWPATCLTAVFACRSGGCSFRESLLLALLLSFVLWLGMEHLLQWQLPQGLLFSSAAGA